MALSGHINLPLLILAGTAAAIGMAMTSSSGLLGKTIAFFEKRRKDYVLKVAAYADIQEDRISQLPDDLLSDIVSRLDFIEALRTRILSRRWKNIWKIMYNLRFDCSKMFEEVQLHKHCSRCHKLKVLKAVDQSLKLYSGKKICRLVLKCCLGKEFISYFNRWMQSIVTSGIQELLLTFWSPYRVDDFGNYIPVGPLSVPLQLLFESGSLTKLNLLNCVLQPICFKGQFNYSLRFLTLELSPLDNGELPSILSSCVNLRWMSVSHCKLPHKLCISGQCLQLESLYIKLCTGVNEIDICADNLTFFHCYTVDTIKYSLRFVPKLEQLNVNFNGSGTVPYMFGEVAKNCTRLQRLLFQTKTDELLHTPAKMNMFSNLRMLSLLMMVDSKADLLSVASILDACPILEELLFSARCASHNEQRGWAWPPRCHTHLKEVKFEGFQGTRYEIAFASYLVRSAPALQQLWICSSYTTYSANCRWTEHRGHLMDDEERRLICKAVVGGAVFGKVQVIWNQEFLVGFGISL